MSGKTLTGTISKSNNGLSKPGKDFVPRRCNKLYDLFSILQNLSNSPLVQSPYFGCLSRILNQIDLEAIRREKIFYGTTREQKKRKSETLGKTTTRSTRSVSTPPGSALDKRVQTKVSHFPKIEKPKTLNNKKTEPCKCNNAKSTRERTKLPPVKRATATRPESLRMCPKQNTNPVVKMRPETVFLYQQPHLMRYWRNEIKNYYDWTSFCLMRKYKNDTKRLKEQLRHLEDQEGKEAETFRKTIETRRKMLNTEKHALSTEKNVKKNGKSQKKKIPTKNKAPSSAAGSGTNKRKTVTNIRNLVPPPSAPDSLFIFGKRDSHEELMSNDLSTVQRKPPTRDSSTLANDTLRSTSDDNIFAIYGKFRNSVIRPMSACEACTSDVVTESQKQLVSEKESKFKSKFTLRH